MYYIYFPSLFSLFRYVTKSCKWCKFFGTHKRHGIKAWSCSDGYLFSTFATLLYYVASRHLLYLVSRNTQYLVSLRDTHIAFYREIYLKYVFWCMIICLLISHLIYIVHLWFLNTTDIQWNKNQGAMSCYGWY